MADLQKEAVATKRVEIEQPTSTESQVERKAKFVFNTCCFCIPLRIGCLILAYLFLIGNVLAGIYTIIGTVTIVNGFTYFPEDYRHVLFKALVGNAISLVLLLLSLPFTIILLNGLHKKKRNFLRIFVIFQSVYIIISILQQIYMSVFLYMHIISIALAVVIDVLNIYYVLVLRSLYVKMGETFNNLPRQLYRDGQVVITP